MEFEFTPPIHVSGMLIKFIINLLMFCYYSLVSSASPSASSNATIPIMLSHQQMHSCEFTNNWMYQCSSPLAVSLSGDNENYDNSKFGDDSDDSVIFVAEIENPLNRRTIEHFNSLYRNSNGGARKRGWHDHYHNYDQQPYQQEYQHSVNNKINKFDIFNSMKYHQILPSTSTTSSIQNNNLLPQPAKRSKIPVRPSSSSSEFQHRKEMYSRRDRMDMRRIIRKSIYSPYFYQKLLREVKKMIYNFDTILNHREFHNMEPLFRDIYCVARLFKPETLTLDVFTRIHEMSVAKLLRNLEFNYDASNSTLSNKTKVTTFLNVDINSTDEDEIDAELALYEKTNQYSINHMVMNHVTKKQQQQKQQQKFIKKNNPITRTATTFRDMEHFTSLFKTINFVNHLYTSDEE